VEVDEGTQVAAQGSYEHMRELQGVLGARGVQAQLVRPPEGRGSG